MEKAALEEEKPRAQHTHCSLRFSLIFVHLFEERKDWPSESRGLRLFLINYQLPLFFF